MKRTRISATGLAGMALLLASCGLELETSGNGKLDGNWHLESIDTLDTSGRLDMKNELVFWAVQSSLLELYGASTGRVVSQFQFDGSTLQVVEPRLYAREDGDPLLEDTERLAAYGINELNERFAVVRLDGGKMTLKSASLQLNFKKH